MPGLPRQGSDLLYTDAMNEEQDDLGSLERAREALYSPNAQAPARSGLSAPADHDLPHEWTEATTPSILQPGKHQVRLAAFFFGGAVLFFVFALLVAGYFFYFGNNSVSTDKVTIDIQGPTTIAGGDTVPLSLTITNKNPTAINNATIEVDFPDGTRSATNVLTPYQRYVENIGTLASGAGVTRSVKAVLFGGTGESLTLPVSVSYGTNSSNAIFEKKTVYTLAVSSTPLSISVDSLGETVSGAPITFTMSVRSNATVPLSNVVVQVSSPFGFSATSASIPLTNGEFTLGTLAPGAVKQITLTGTLTGQNNEQRVFHFTVGTAKSAKDQTLAVSYMTQDATVGIAAPFITAALSVNGDSSNSIVVGPGSTENAVLSYTNTLTTPVTNASVTISISGSGIDYNSIRAANGFYNSADHTIIYSKDTDPSLSSLAPGASGIGTFTFMTVPAGVSSPTITFSISASGTRVGESNVPEKVSTSATKTVRVATAIGFSSIASHSSDPFSMVGPIPPKANQQTGYVVIWNISNKGSTIAGGAVTATLPSYVTYTGKNSGTGSFSYDTTSRTVTWNVGDIAQNTTAQGIFEVMLTPSTSQQGGAVPLTSAVAFSGFDRFAGANVTASAVAATTETVQDPGYTAENAVVH
jgi:hypothetical protein